MKYLLTLALGLILSSNIWAQEKADMRRSIQPDSLATAINTGADSAILILNTGPVDDILHAINIGAVSEKPNLKKLKKYLKDVPKDKEIVIYCGCCPFATCPNLDPAYDLLSSMKFENFKILKLDDDLKMDWIDKGYPMPE